MRWSKDDAADVTLERIDPAEDMVMLVCSVQALIQAMHRYTTSSSMGSTSAISIVELQSADDY